VVALTGQHFGVTTRVDEAPTGASQANETLGTFKARESCNQTKS
jgi:hypothetical protein